MENPWCLSAALEHTDFYFSSLQTFVFLVPKRTNFSPLPVPSWPPFPALHTLALLPEAHSALSSGPALAQQCTNSPTPCQPHSSPHVPLLAAPVKGHRRCGFIELWHISPLPRTGTLYTKLGCGVSCITSCPTECSQLCCRCWPWWMGTVWVTPAHSPRPFPSPQHPAVPHSCLQKG